MISIHWNSYWCMDQDKSFKCSRCNNSIRPLCVCICSMRFSIVAWPRISVLCSTIRWICLPICTHFTFFSFFSKENVARQLDALFLSNKANIGCHINIYSPWQDGKSARMVEEILAATVCVWLAHFPFSICVNRNEWQRLCVENEKKHFFFHCSVAVLLIAVRKVACLNPIPVRHRLLMVSGEALFCFYAMT